MSKRLMDKVVLGWVILIILAALFGNVSLAATRGGETPADFLMIGNGARAAGMGGAFSAMTDGAEATYWNPAGLSTISTYNVAFSHFAWYQDISIEHGAAAFAISDRAALAASITYLGYGDIEGYDATGASIGNISAYDWVGGLSLGYELTPAVSLGITGKFINLKLDESSASAFAADFGLMVKYSQISLAAVAGNVGTKVSFNAQEEGLPRVARLGLAVDPFNYGLRAAIEWEKRIYGNAVIRNGLEWGFQDQYFLRSGYSYYTGESNRDFSDGLSFGAGLRFGVAAIDYAYSVKDSQSNEDIHRFSLSFGLN